MEEIGRNKNAIETYIRNQLQEDHTEEQLTIRESTLTRLRVSRHRKASKEPL